MPAAALACSATGHLLPHLCQPKPTHQPAQCASLHGTHALVAASKPPSPQKLHSGWPSSSNVHTWQPAPQLLQAPFRTLSPSKQDLHWVSLVQSVQLVEQCTQVEPLAT